MVNSKENPHHSIIFSIVWMVLSLFIFYINTPTTAGIHTLLTVMIVFSYVFTILRWVRTGNRLFSIFSLFVVFSLFYNTGQSFLYSFTSFPLMWSIYDIFQFEDVCYMLKYHLICSSGFYFGTALYTYKKTRNVSLNKVSSFYKNISSGKNGIKNDYRYLIFIISLLAVFYSALKQIHMRQTMSYAELMQARNIISEFYSFGTISLGIYYIMHHRHIKLVLISWMSIFLLFNIAGTRSMSIVYMAALILVVPIIKPQFFKNKFIGIWIVALIIGITSISIMSNVRQGTLGAGGTDSQGTLVALYSSINEMGISQTPTITTINSVKHGEPHAQTIIFNLLMGFIPSDILKNMVPQEWSNVMLGKWATQQELGARYTYQLGYSWLAELYLNYGEFAWIFALIYAYLIAFMENYSIKRMIKGEYLVAICLLAILCKQVFFARCQLNNFMQFYKLSVYLIIFRILFIKKNISRQ